MNKRIKKLWVNALRTGEISHKRKHVTVRKRKSHLRVGKVGFCCLGVLCEIYRIDTGKGEWDEQPDVTSFKIGNNYDDETLPEAVWKWAGLPDTNPDTSIRRGGNVILTLTNINDYDGYPFSKIADIIERDL